MNEHEANPALFKWLAQKYERNQELGSAKNMYPPEI